MKSPLGIGLLGLMLIAATAPAQEFSIVVMKGRAYAQTSAAAPAPVATGGARFVAEAPALTGITTGASVRLPGGATRAMPEVAGEGLYRFTATADTPAALGATYPAGSYLVDISSSILPMSGTAVLPADNFPPAPQVANFAAAQAINAASDFTVNLAALAGATPDETLDFAVWEGSNEVVADTLPATEAAWQISADTLEGGTTYELRITYRRLTIDFGSVPAVSVGFFSETRLPLKTAGGPPVDTTPPLLGFTNPPDATNPVIATTPILFAFSEPMDKTKLAIQWDISLDPAKFNYQWNEAGQLLTCTYTGGFPNGVHMWTLNPTPAGANNFRDVAGNHLAMVSGSFSTVGGTGGCEGETPIETAGFSLFKELVYLQPDAGAPQPHPTEGGMFFGTYGEFTAGGVSPDVTIEFPAPPAAPPHQVKAFTKGVGGFAFLMEAFATQAALEAAYPDTTYAMQLRDMSLPPASQVTNSTTLQILPSAQPPTPHFANYAEAQAVNPAADFTLRWDAFAGAGAQDFIMIEIVNEAGEVIFFAPDACNDILLPVTATSIVVPKGILTEGKIYNAKLSFLRLTDQGKTLAGKTGLAGVGRVTHMRLKTTGGTATAPRFLSIKALSSTQIEVEVELTVGRPFTLLEGSSPAGIGTTLLSTNPPTSPLKLTVPLTPPYRFLRGRTD